MKRILSLVLGLTLFTSCSAYKQHQEDNALQAKVVAAIQADRLGKQLLPSLKITAAQGVIGVQGTLSSETERDAILKLIRGVEGVESINDLVDVGDRPTGGRFGY
ncbi:BON domain-containing protein [bacterium]|nr:BON domain-containing protein [bacterium]